MKVHRIAVVGCGGISRAHFAAYQAHPERVEVVAACDPWPEARSWARQTFGIGVYSSIADMVDAGGWDVAVVCTPSHVRIRILNELAASGKHILVEKPLSDNLDDAREIVETCEQAGVFLAVNQNFRDQYSFNLARQLLDENRVGAVLGVEHRDLTFRQDKGWRIERMRHAMAVMGVHWFDGFRILLGREATQVFCRTFSSPAIDCCGETDAFVHLLFHQIPVSYIQSFSSNVPCTETIVLGERGTLRLGYKEAAVLPPGGEPESIANPFAGQRRRDTMFRSLEHLLVAVETGSPPSNSGRDNLWTVALLDGAYRSATLGRPVDLVDALSW